MADKDEGDALFERLRVQLVHRSIREKQLTAEVTVLESELERLRRQIRALEASGIPSDVQENARLKTQVDRFRVMYENHNATVGRLKRAIASHHPGQPTCDTCQSVLRSMGGGKDHRL